MKHARRLALSLILAGPLAAQEGLVSAAEARRPQTVSLEFQGGSLSDLIAAIRRAADGANIVASALASEVELPAITLRDATVHQALEATRNIVPEPYAVGVERHIDAGGHPVFSVQVVRDLPRQTAAGPAWTGVAGMPERRGVRVFSIRSLIEARPSDPPGFADKLLSTETVLSAIENGLEVSRPVSHGKVRTEGKAPWDMRYHEDSRLLFVSAHPEQLSVVHEVLRALEQDIEQARVAASQAAQTKAQADPKDR